jgi:hypothetical protein
MQHRSGRTTESSSPSSISRIRSPETDRGVRIADPPIPIASSSLRDDLLVKTCPIAAKPDCVDNIGFFGDQSGPCGCCRTTQSCEAQILQKPSLPQVERSEISTGIESIGNDAGSSAPCSKDNPHAPDTSGRARHSVMPKLTRCRSYCL